jgi:hypothetical protein
MINWLVDTLLTERHENTGFPTLAEAARELGHNVYQTKYVPFSERPDTEIPFEDGQCVVSYGTVQFVKQIEKYYGRMWTPGMFFNANVKSFVKFAVPLREDLLNDDYIILPYGEFEKRGPWSLGTVFIKPESGMKEFTGQVVNDYGDLKKLSPHGIIQPDTLCVIAKPKLIKAEFRYVICEKKVITGSEYRWDDVLDVRADTHPICDAMAKKVAESDWQADTVYVCDVALIEELDGDKEDWGYEVARVIELNAFSSSGLYACDTYKIVEAVSKAAEKEHAGILD